VATFCTPNTFYINMRSYLHTFGIFTFTILVLTLASSCKDDDQGMDSNPFTAPRVNIISPLLGSTFNSSDNIPLKLTIEQDADILSYRVLIRDRDTEEAVFVLSEFTESRFINIDTIISLNVVIQSLMSIEVRAEDSFGNQIDEVVSTFTLNPPKGNFLSLNFDLNYDNELFVLDKEYEYPSGEKFEFSRFDMYISNVTLIKDTEEIVIADIDFLKMTPTFANAVTAADGFNYTIAGIEDGEYDGIKFNIGLTSEMNNTTPSDYPVTHPLGLAGDHWPTWDSYIFVSIEGRMDIDTSNPDYEQGIALHLGSDEAMRTIILDDSISLANDQNKILPISIDLRDLFVNQDGEIYDIVSTPSTHNLSEIPEVIELADNLKNSINK